MLNVTGAQLSIANEWDGKKRKLKISKSTEHSIQMVCIVRACDDFRCVSFFFGLVGFSENKKNVFHFEFVLIMQSIEISGIVQKKSGAHRLAHMKCYPMGIRLLMFFFLQFSQQIINSFLEAAMAAISNIRN